VILAMRAAGFDVQDPLLGVDDVVVLRTTFASDLLVISRDKDMVKLVRHDRRACHGLVLARYSGPGSWRSRAGAIVSQLMNLRETLRGQILVLDDGRAELLTLTRGP
jgi:hypothetical protein